jgi:hypothetical protein
LLRRRIIPETTTSTVTTTITPYKAWPWVWPWVVHIALAMLAIVLWLLWGSSDALSRGILGGMLGAAVVVLTLAAWHMFRPRGPSLRLHATITVGYMGAWLFWATMLSPFSEWIFYLWLMMFLFGSASWMMRRSARGQGGDHEDGWAQMLDLTGSRVKSARRDGDNVRATIQVQRGRQNWRNVAAAVKGMASWLGLRDDQFHIERDQHDDAVAHVTISEEDRLGQAPRWAGPSAPGRSIADAPCVIGTREAGGPLRFWLPADEDKGRSLQHLLITGMMGTGKSVCGRLIVCEVGSRDDTQIWLGDPVKGRQFLGPVAHLAKHVASTPDDCMKMIADLNALITERGDHLGDRGLDNWVPGCGLPFIYAHFEEIAAKIGTTRQFANLSQHARSVGISIGASLQKATHVNLSTDARSNIATVFQFGCKEGDQPFALSRQLLEAGAAPQAWTNKKPGYLYAETPGCDETGWARPARTAFATVADFRRLMPPDAVDLGGADGAALAEPAGFIASGKASPDEARKMFLIRLDQLRDGGQREVRPADFADMLAVAERSETWLNGALGKLVEAKALARSRHGVYTFTTKR